MKTPAQLTEGITPLPWHSAYDPNDVMTQTHWVGIGNGIEHIARATVTSSGSGVAINNAAYIVKACNSLPKLVEALDGLLNRTVAEGWCQTRAHEEPCACYSCRVFDEVDKARAALKEVLS